MPVIPGASLTNSWHCIERDAKSVRSYVQRAELLEMTSKTMCR